MALSRLPFPSGSGVPMRYLSVFIPQQQHKPIVVVDQNKPERLSLIDAIYYTDFHNGHAFISNYKNVLNVKLKRRADTGEIKLSEIPQRLEGDELLAKLEALQVRGKDKQARQMHPNSLANLCPRERFTRENRPCKKRLLTEEQLAEAKRLRESGLAWRMLGDRYEVKHDTLRLALKRRGTNRQIAP